MKLTHNQKVAKLLRAETERFWKHREGNKMRFEALDAKNAATHLQRMAAILAGPDHPQKTGSGDNAPSGPNQPSTPIKPVSTPDDEDEDILTKLEPLPPDSYGPQQ